MASGTCNGHGTGANGEIHIEAGVFKAPNYLASPIAVLECFMERDVSVLERHRFLASVAPGLVGTEIEFTTDILKNDSLPLNQFFHF